MRDRSDGHQHASGKQRLHRGGIWYTAQSGIWQTVWVEAVPAVHVEALTLVPHLEDGSVEVTVHAADGTASVRVGGTRTGSRPPRPGSALDDPHPWTPDDPHLHDVEVELGDDRVTSYVALRSFGVGPDDDGIPRLLLNGVPHLPVGVLDQGYWPDGLLTAPSDAAMVHDITTMKDLGFDLLRKHVKVEPLRWYAHCDRIGMLVWQDVVNGGGRDRTAAVTWPGRYPVRLGDTAGGVAGSRRRGRPGAVPRGAAAHRRAPAQRRVARRAGCRSTRAGASSTPPRSPTRSASSTPHGSSTTPAAGTTRAAATCAASTSTASGSDSPGAATTGRWCSRSTAATASASRATSTTTRPTSATARSRRRTDGRVVHPAARALADDVPRGLSATVYTQVSDVEDELNGLLTYDREVLKLDAAVVRAALDRLRATLSREANSAYGGSHNEGTAP